MANLRFQVRRTDPAPVASRVARVRMLCRRHGCRHQRAGSGQHTGPDGSDRRGHRQDHLWNRLRQGHAADSKPKKTFPKGVKKIAWSLSS